MAKRKGESTACTHVYLYIGRAKDLRGRKWGGGGERVDFHVWVPTNGFICLLGTKRQREQQLRRRVSGFTPCSDPLAIMLRSANMLNMKLLRVAAHHLQSDLKLQRIRGQELPFTGICIGVGVSHLRVQLNANFIT